MAELLLYKPSHSVFQKLDGMNTELHLTFRSRESKVKEKMLGRNEIRFRSRGGKSILLLERTQAVPARPSDNNRVKMKTLGW